MLLLLLQFLPGLFSAGAGWATDARGPSMPQARVLTRWTSVVFWAGVPNNLSKDAVMGTPQPNCEVRYTGAQNRFARFSQGCVLALFHSRQTALEHPMFVVYPFALLPGPLVPSPPSESCCSRACRKVSPDAH